MSHNRNCFTLFMASNLSLIKHLVIALMTFLPSKLTLSHINTHTQHSVVSHTCRWATQVGTCDLLQIRICMSTRACRAQVQVHICISGKSQLHAFVLMHKHVFQVNHSWPCYNYYILYTISLLSTSSVVSVKFLQS